MSGHLKIGSNVKIGGASGVIEVIFQITRKLWDIQPFHLRDFVKMSKKNEK